MAQEFNIGLAVDAVAAAIPDREALVFGDRRFTFAQLHERARRLASYLHGRGLGFHTPRSELAGHEVGQDLLGIYAHNGNEWFEGMTGAFLSRLAPFNVNSRYVGEELRSLFDDARPGA